MEFTRTDDDGDVFVESEFAVQCYSKDQKCQAERNSQTADRESVRLIKVCNLLTRANDDSFCLRRVENLGRF